MEVLDTIIMNKNLGLFSNINSSTTRVEREKLKKLIVTKVYKKDYIHYYKSEISDNIRILNTFYSYYRLKKLVYYINELCKYTNEFANYSKIDICRQLADY